MGVGRLREGDLSLAAEERVFAWRANWSEWACPVGREACEKNVRSGLETEESFSVADQGLHLFFFNFYFQDIFLSYGNYSDGRKN